MALYIVIDNDGWEHSWRYMFKFRARHYAKYLDVHQSWTAPHSIKRVK